MNQSISDKGVCRTALATPGLYKQTQTFTFGDGLFCPLSQTVPSGPMYSKSK